MATKTGAQKGSSEKAGSTGVKRPKAASPKPAAPKPRGRAIDAARLTERNAGRRDAAIPAAGLARDLGVLMTSVFPELVEANASLKPADKL